MGIQFSARTDVGRVREQNEDNFLVDRKLQLYVVCDGMGGHLSGEVASATAVNVVRETLLAHRATLDDYRNCTGSVTDADVEGLLTQAVQTACFRIYERGRLNPEQRGMGTTLSLMVLLGHRGFIAHVGDSRVYRLRSGQLQQLTSDHSLYNAMLQSGAEIDGAMLVGRLKNAVTRAVGVQETVEVDTASMRLQPSDRYLLCTDGLTGYMEDPDLERALAGPDIQAAVSEMIRHANSRGGRDNITAVIVEMPDEDAFPVAGSDRADRLRGTSLVAGLEATGLSLLANAMVERVHPADAVIVEAGTNAEALLVVTEGGAVGPGEHRVGRGAVLAAASWLTHRPQQCPVTATPDGPVHLLALTRPDFDRLAAERPGLAARLMQNLATVVADRLVDAAEASGDPGVVLGRVSAPAPPTRRAPHTLDLDPADIMEAEPGALAPGPPPVPPSLPPVDGRLEDEDGIDIAVADTLPYYKVDEELAAGVGAPLALEIAPQAPDEPPRDGAADDA